MVLEKQVEAVSFESQWLLRSCESQQFGPADSAMRPWPGGGTLELHESEIQSGAVKK